MTNTNTAGRPATFANARARAAALNALAADQNAVSRYLKLQLVDADLLTTEKVHTGKRGRPQVIYTLTGKGRGLVALSKNWN